MARRPRLDRELERYLVDDETVIVAVRRHWFHLAKEIALAVVATVVAFWVDVNVPRSPGGQVLQNLTLALWWAAAGWLVWRFLNWRHDWFVATDKRFLLFYGFVRRKVAMMPLLRVTDMTFDRTLLGRLIGYGKFILESAGQMQALSAIDHVPDADRHYRAICTQLFGPGSTVGGVKPRGFSLPPAPDDDGTSGGDGGGRGGPGGPGPRDGASPAGAPSGARPEPARSPEPAHKPESWYRSSNLRGPNHLGDTGEIPVVRVPREDDEEAPLYPPRAWVDRHRS